MSTIPLGFAFLATTVGIFSFICAIAIIKNAPAARNRAESAFDRSFALAIVLCGLYFAAIALKHGASKYSDANAALFDGLITGISYLGMANAIALGLFLLGNAVYLSIRRRQLDALYLSGRMPHEQRQRYLRRN